MKWNKKYQLNLLCLLYNKNSFFRFSESSTSKDNEEETKSLNSWYKQYCMLFLYISKINVFVLYILEIHTYAQYAMKEIGFLSTKENDILT